LPDFFADFFAPPFADLPALATLVVFAFFDFFAFLAIMSSCCRQRIASDPQERLPDPLSRFAR
jgi:hypothetical protein